MAALLAAVLLPILRPVFQRWVRLFRSSRLHAVLSLALLLAFVYVGGSLNKPNLSGSGPSLRTGGSPALPLFYHDLGCPTADTDGDGIPDYWERRTHTNRLVPDSAADYDHDGVDNAEEFLHQCDPLTKDTDGDGLTDREEIDGMAAGMAGFDPIPRCDYPADETDENAWDNDTGIVAKCVLLPYLEDMAIRRPTIQKEISFGQPSLRERSIKVPPIIPSFHIEDWMSIPILMPFNLTGTLFSRPTEPVFSVKGFLQELRYPAYIKAPFATSIFNAVQQPPQEQPHDKAFSCVFMFACHQQG
jgi:hypothetical protein